MSEHDPSCLPAFSFPLFVPGNRPDRIAKACASGADSVIIDLEDAVAAGDKVKARAALFDALPEAPQARLFLRINAIGTTWHEDDLVLATQASFSGIMLAKSETSQQVTGVRQRLRPEQALIALVESAVGLHHADALAQAADRLAFGSLDYAEDIGCGASREALLFARSRLVLAARLAEKPVPLDGVTTALRNTELIKADAAHACELGFGGKLVIHPDQLAPTRAGFRPAEDDITWAHRVLDQASSEAAASVDGVMVDAPVLARAKRILNRAEAVA